nr:hypothetical protein [Tanacetum cinerariifolium]
MWRCVKRLMRGTIQNKVDRETRFTNQFDQFVVEPGEVLVSVYNQFAQLMNDLEQNDMHFPIVIINTKFLNSFHPEWLKYVTQVRLAKHLTVDMFDDLFDYLQQFKKLVNTSRAKKSEKYHDLLAVVAHTGSLISVKLYIFKTLKYELKQQKTVLSKQLESYKKNVWVFEITKGNNTMYFNEYIEANQKARRFEKETQSQFIHDRDIIRDLEQQRDKLELSVVVLKRQAMELHKTQSILKRKISENEDKYHDTVLDLEAKAKKNIDVVLKFGNSLQEMFMLGPKPMSFYDSNPKYGLGYANPYTLKKAISQNLKLYDASCLDDSKIHMNIRDTEEILDDATKRQIKMKNKFKDPIAIEKKMFVQLIIKS